MGRRKHADWIRLWLENEDSEVWFKSKSGKWYPIKHPTWEDDEYRVILPEFKEAWQAYMDGELQVRHHHFQHQHEWWEYHEGDPPLFDMLPSNYRRRPKRDERRLVFVPESIFDNWTKYDDEECAKEWNSIGEVVCALLFISRGSYQDIVVGRWAGDGWMSQESPGEWSGPVRGVKFYKVV